MFPDERGRPLTPRALYRIAFKRVLRRAGLPENITFHEATRHTCAKVLCSRGKHPKFVQELLGHASTNITMDIYSHVIEGMDGGLADAMDSALG